jgi:hypothetical protein
MKYLLGGLKNIAIAMIIIFVLLVVLVAVFGNNTPTEVSTPTPTQKVVVQEPVLTVSAYQLATDYDNNEVSANTQYLDKVVRVEGEVKEITSYLEEPSVILKGNESVWVDVQCYFPKEETEKLSVLSKGDKVTVIGKVTGQFFNVDVKEARMETE